MRILYVVFVSLVIVVTLGITSTSAETQKPGTAIVEHHYRVPVQGRVFERHYRTKVRVPPAIEYRTREATRHGREVVVRRRLNRN